MAAGVSIVFYVNDFATLSGSEFLSREKLVMFCGCKIAKTSPIYALQRYYVCLQHNLKIKDLWPANINYTTRASQ